MGKAFSIQGEVQLDTQGAKADLAGLEKTQTKIPIAMDAREAKRQAEAMLSLVDRMDRKVARPRVDTTSIKQAKDAVTSLDKAWDRVAAGQKAKLQQLSGAFSAGQSLSYGGVGGLVSAMPALAGAGGAAMLAAGGGAAVGALAAAGIGQGVVASVNRAMQGQKLESFMGRAYKDQAAGFVTAADKMAAATGFLTDDFMRAALIGKTLVNNYGLQTDQIKRLVEVSADLAATSPYEDIQTVSNAMERLQSAVRGEAEASERLGLTLNDTYMKNIAFGGSLKDTWEKLSDLEKAQYRYQEILNQTKDVLGSAEDDEGLSTQLRKVKGELTAVGVSIGEHLLPALSEILDRVSEFIDRVPSWVWTGIGEAAEGMATGQSWGPFGAALQYQNIALEDLDRAKRIQAAEKRANFVGAVVGGAGRWLPASVQSEIAAVASSGRWLPESIQTKITLVNDTGTPIKVQDAGSYAPSNH